MLVYLVFLTFFILFILLVQLLVLEDELHVCRRGTCREKKRILLLETNYQIILTEIFLNTKPCDQFAIKQVR